jgi:hypothetical protein
MHNTRTCAPDMPRTDTPSHSRYTQLRAGAFPTSNECGRPVARALHQFTSCHLNSEQHRGSSRDRQLSLGSAKQWPKAENATGDNVYPHQWRRCQWLTLVHF